MVIIKLEDVQMDKLAVKKSKDNTYLQLGMDIPRIQTPWITLGRWSLPSKKFVKETDESVSLSIPVEKDSPVYNFFTAVDNFLISKHLVDMKILHTFVSKREEQHYVKFKIYKTTKIFVERENEGFNTIYDLYDYLVEGRDIRLIFTFSKLWQLNNSYGFSCRVEQLQLKAGQQSKKDEEKANPLSFSED